MLYTVYSILNWISMVTISITTGYHQDMIWKKKLLWKWRKYSVYNFKDAIPIEIHSVMHKLCSKSLVPPCFLVMMKNHLSQPPSLHRAQQLSEKFSWNWNAPVGCCWGKLHIGKSFVWVYVMDWHPILEKLTLAQHHRNGTTPRCLRC